MNRFLSELPGGPGQEGRRQRKIGIQFGGIVLLFCLLTAPCFGQLNLTLLDDLTLADDALLMPQNAPYGRAINGVSFQTEPFLTLGNYQYATWYRAQGIFSEDLMLARRNLTTGAIEIMDTDRDLVNGDSSGSEGSSSWDAHNVVSMGISTGDNRIHLSYDHHGSQLNYTPSVVNAATDADWNGSILQDERGSLNNSGPLLNGITYPRLISTPDGGLNMTYRTGGSGSGNLWFATYDHNTGLWDSPQQIITGTNGLVYSDVVNTSTSRNAYLNGVNYDSAGRIHMTWTWRESAGGSNHDIMYAFSDDGGENWRNGAGQVIGGPLAGGPIDLNSPGTIIDDGSLRNGVLGQLDRTNTLMNQQAQTVDADGRVHVVMWHKRDGAPPQFNPPFTTEPAAYYHYVRDPLSGDWSRNELPISREVGSRPDIAYDSLGNLYVSYLSPGPGDGQGVLDYYTEGDLIIAGATKAANYTDWSIIHTDNRDFAGEPFLDQNRLLQDGVLSAFIQEHDDANTGQTGTPLHVLEYKPSAKLTWTGDDTGIWQQQNSGTDWDTLGDHMGNARFHDGYDVVFDDTAPSFDVQLVGTVSPRSTEFRNTPGNNYTLTGVGSLSGIHGSLKITGGGRVTMDNDASNFEHSVDIHDGELLLIGDTSLGNGVPITYTIGEQGVLDVSQTNGQTLWLGQAELVSEGTIEGDVSVDSLSSVTMSSTSTISGDVTLEGASFTGSGHVGGSLSVLGESLVRIGGGFPSGEALAVGGDFSLSEASLLELEIHSPSVHDLLEVDGTLLADGALQVVPLLDAPPPQLGEVFDILNFATITGSFDTYQLPALDAGLAWNVSSLYTSGALEVVTDVDLDNDGDVDGFDLLLIQRNDPSKIAVWKTLYGSQLVNSLSQNTVPVPEPASGLIALLSLSWARSRRRRASAF